ncbi:flavin reductase [Lentisphaera profundi]|uniref:Flavin reductase n=1 Tax=Lentisphaera profundi TaxID=1658616 RepID=A0ABY7VXQ5_9BACT|nr:flavin reductase [Lentisphaera profundi]WDE98988.1 flavin reductase [Lentisphaera profundi]
MSQQLISKDDFQTMEKRYRTNFVNSLSGFKSLCLAGTISTDGMTNLAPISSVVHIGANPVLMGMVMRPDTVTRDTLKNIRETKFWTLNHITADFFKAAHQCAARYPADISEFKATGLSPYYGSISAPYVEQSSIQIGLELKEEITIQANGTHLLIGQVIEVMMPNEIVREDGSLDIEKARSITVSGLDTYHSTSEISRLAYPKA